MSVLMKRPTTSNADEWQLYLQDGLQGVPASGCAFLAVQIVEAIEEHQRALAREVYGLREQTEAECEGVARLDLEGKQGAFARGRIHEAKSIARAINAIMPYSRDPAALSRIGGESPAATLPPRDQASSAMLGDERDACASPRDETKVSLYQTAKRLLDLAVRIEHASTEAEEGRLCDERDALLAMFRAADTRGVSALHSPTLSKGERES